MNKETNPFQSTIAELAALGEKNKKLEKALKGYLQTIQKRADEEKQSINAILSILFDKPTIVSKRKKIANKKRIKLSDEEILDKVMNILSGGKKLAQSEIIGKIGVQYIRFKLFLQRHPDLLDREGRNKTSRWFLKQ